MAGITGRAPKTASNIADPSMRDHTPLAMAWIKAIGIGRSFTRMGSLIVISTYGQPRKFRCGWHYRYPPLFRRLDRLDDT
jgi:hypothetical protein